MRCTYIASISTLQCGIVALSSDGLPGHARRRFHGLLGHWWRVAIQGAVFFANRSSNSHAGSEHDEVSHAGWSPCRTHQSNMQRNGSRLRKAAPAPPVSYLSGPMLPPSTAPIPVLAPPRRKRSTPRMLSPIRTPSDDAPPEETEIERKAREEKEEYLRFLMTIFPFHYCVACHKCVSPIEQVRWSHSPRGLRFRAPHRALFMCAVDRVHRRARGASAPCATTATSCGSRRSTT